MKYNKHFYWILAILSVAGFAWIGLHLFFPDVLVTSSSTVCLFKNVTSLPCPSCGITRSVLLIFHGDFQEAPLLNPLGFVVALALITLPVWILYDILSGKTTLAHSILWTEKLIKSRKSVYIPLVALVLINWGWNILKNL
jgi:hypothetical protein